MGKYSRLFNNILLVFIGNAGAKLIGLLMLPFYTHWLSRADYGTTDLINVCVTISISIITCCLSEAVFRLPKGQPVDVQKKYFSTGLTFSLTGFFAAALVFYIFTRFWITKGVFFEYAHFIYLIFLTTFLQSYFQQFTRSIDKMNIYVLSGVLLTVFTAGFAFLLIPRFGLNGFLWSQILATSCASLFSLIFGKLWKYMSIRAINTVRFREMLNYSLPLVPNAVMAWLINGANRVFLEKFHGMDTVGIFAAALKFPMMISTVFQVFFISWQISAIEEYKSDRYKDFYNKIFSAVFLVLTFSAVAIVLSSGLLTTIFVDGKFSDAQQYIPILTIAPFISCLAVFVGVNFIASKETKYLFSTTVYGGITCIIANFILVPPLGIMGAAYSQILSFTVMLILRIYHTRKTAGINQKMQYILSFVSMLLMVFLFRSSISLKYPIIVFVIMLMIFFNKNSLKLLIHAAKSKIKATKA